MTAHRQISLRTISVPALGTVVSAPPVIKVRDHTIEYPCGHCGTVLMHAEEGQVPNVTILCTGCGSYNSVDA